MTMKLLSPRLFFCSLLLVASASLAAADESAPAPKDDLPPEVMQALFPAVEKTQYEWQPKPGEGWEIDLAAQTFRPVGA